jgi:hypothetical protein
MRPSLFRTIVYGKYSSRPPIFHSHCVCFDIDSFADTSHVQRAVRPSLTLRLAVDAYWARHVAWRDDDDTSADTDAASEERAAGRAGTSVHDTHASAKAGAADSGNHHTPRRHAVVGWHVRLSDWGAFCRTRSNTLRQQVAFPKFCGTGISEHRFLLSNINLLGMYLKPFFLKSSPFVLPCRRLARTASRSTCFTRRASSACAPSHWRAPPFACETKLVLPLAARPSRARMHSLPMKARKVTRKPARRLESVTCARC